MTEYFISFIAGLFTGMATRYKDEDWKEQRKVYEARLQDQANTIEYYKRLTKKVVEENKTLKTTILKKASEK
jgi:uncharacterized membrane-anchored protein YhcB (DUF1043 family)